MRCIYSTKDFSPTSKAIRLGTDSTWSHVDLILPHDLKLPEGVPVDDGAKVIGALAWRGVVIRPMSEIYARATKVGLGEVLVPDEKAAWEWALAQLGKGYDWLGVFGIGARLRFEDKNRLFCSEFKLGFVEAGGLYMFGDDNSRFTPRDGWTSPLLRNRRIQTVRQGKVVTELVLPNAGFEGNLHDLA